MENTNISTYAIHLTIGTTEYKVHQLTITAPEIKALAMPEGAEEYDLFLEVDGHQNTTLIPNDGSITLVEGMTFFMVHRQNPTVPIIINAQHYPAPKHVMTGAEIKQLANIPTDYSLYLIPTAREDELISDNQIVYLIRDEQFVSMKNNITNGNMVVSASTILPQREISYLDTQGYQYELHRSDNGELLLVLRNFDLGENYTPRNVDLLVKIPQGFPTAEMDMFWVQPSVMKVNGHPPDQVIQETLLNGSWQRFSRHRESGTWNPIMGGLRAHFTFVLEALCKGE